MLEMMLDLLTGCQSQLRRRNVRNRAKCKLCGDILESFHRTDYVQCSCGEIGIDGGDHQFLCETKHWENFLRIDDTGKVTEVIPQESMIVVADKIHEGKPKKEELLEMLDNMIQNIEDMPEQAMTLPLTHYDGFSILTLVSALFRSEN
jgi:hypothetical protein